MDRNKNIWTLFYNVGLLDDDVYEKIRSIKGKEWTIDFANKVYENVKKAKKCIYNLSPLC